ncbi:DUF2973 domain-containing protein [Gloeobacter violaceus]|uniref:Gsl2477 protein n=1 Tax=Gloeobacter violaceus (strain ATCC 29082 / PCC 7421) TaxID=251221 RepID=Q7NHQ8_GLOVI|nr:DUF2973 domain-containing protein [Gloeobacter violaceus]BAC90418.1 gsl2477 [Gloeobacter violaceus PCC 7421]
MLLHLLYLLCFLLLGTLAFYTMATGWRQKQQGRANRIQPHPELLDRNGRVIKDSLLVVRVTPRDTDIRSRLEALYNRSPDDERRDR